MTKFCTNARRRPVYDVYEIFLASVFFIALRIVSELQVRRVG